jgi:transposase-like protein
MPQKNKIAPEEKARIIEQYLRGELGRNEASRRMREIGRAHGFFAG